MSDTEVKRRGRRPAVRSSEEGPGTPVDVHVGSRVRLRRTLLGMSQEKLAAAIGLTFQQVQKYERGANRIGASRLFDLAQVLNVPISFFYDDMPAELMLQGAETALPPELHSSESVELVRAYYQIDDEKLRKAVLQLAQAASGEVRVRRKRGAA